ncbi:MAG: hypothetical protein HC846_01675 [Blastocatellia bacterium]|nr:hypothetical protein [Blastocatellia bacterium]
MNGVSARSENPNGRCCTMVAKNMTGAGLVYQGVINQPADMLNLHPGVNGEKATVRWVAPQVGYYRLEGRFQGIDIAGTSSDVSINWNVSTIWSNNINGFGSTATFDLIVDVSAGTTLDFVVGYGSNNNYFNDSTGLAVNITQITVPPPPSGVYNAVNDFIPTSNPTGVWRYGVKTSPTSLLNITTTVR